MASKMGIAFVKGGIIPAAILKKDKDVHVPPHEAIEVPADYGQHLIDDKFAYAKEVEKASKAGKKDVVAGQQGGDDNAALIAAAEKALHGAEAKLAAAGEDKDAKAAAGREIAAAKNVLKKLKA